LQNQSKQIKFALTFEQFKFMKRLMLQNRQEETTSLELIKQKVEEIGVAFEKTGIQPMIGRVLGFLLLADPPYQTFYAIQEFLGASKSSISHALNSLMFEGIVEYITFSGDRKRYFRLNVQNWLEDAKCKMSDFREVDKVLVEAMQLRDPNKHPEFNEGLRKIFSFHVFMSQEMPKMIAKWERLQAGEAVEDDQNE
jgi:DNA-binding transcriptional regulator GbsR (MarR family)